MYKELIKVLTLKGDIDRIIMNKNNNEIKFINYFSQIYLRIYIIYVMYKHA